MLFQLNAKGTLSIDKQIIVLDINLKILILNIFNTKLSQMKNSSKIISLIQLKMNNQGPI